MKTIWKSKTLAPMTGMFLLMGYMMYISFREPTPYTTPALLLLAAFGAVMIYLQFAWLRNKHLLTINETEIVIWGSGWPRKIPLDHVMAVRINRFSKPTSFRRANGVVFIDYRDGGIAHAYFTDAEDFLAATEALTRQFPERCQFLLDHVRYEGRKSVVHIE